VDVDLSGVCGRSFQPGERVPAAGQTSRGADALQAGDRHLAQLRRRLLEHGKHSERNAGLNCWTFFDCIFAFLLKYVVAGLLFWVLMLCLVENGRLSDRYRIGTDTGCIVSNRLLLYRPI